MDKLKFAFPDLKPEFWLVIKERIKANNICDDRLLDAINHCIDTCIYPTPTIATIIGFDKRIKTYTFTEVLRIVNETGMTQDKLFISIDTGNGSPVWIDKANFNICGYPKWVVEKKK